MSHFSVIVCIDDPGKLEQMLAPFDENREIDPYRDYEKGEPGDHWLYGSLKRAVEHVANGTGIKPYKPDEFGWSSASSKQTPEEQRRELEADAELFRSLPDPVTWADIARIYNERYPDEERPLLVDDSGRAYTMSTYNPDSKWDYWRIGGRWAGYFPYRQEFAAQVIKSEHAWVSPDMIMPLHCDGGPKRALDLNALREEAAAKARKTFAEFQDVIAGTPDALPWASFRDLIDSVPGYTIDQARTEYHSQPRVQKIQQSDFRWNDDPIAEFAVGEKVYTERQRARAVPGFATLTLDGKWTAPGRMGWFATTDATESTQIGYWEAANAYIDTLSDDTHLIVLDCHI